MSIGKKYPTLPENADKILFAEDLVNYILSELNLPVLSSGIADYRAHVYNAFGPELKLATNYTCDCGEEETAEDFERFLKNKTVDIKHFVKYVTYIKSLGGAFVPSESKAQDFLTFCARISMMAAKFYKRGILDAPALAFDHIFSIIKDTDMVEDGGWKALNTISTSWAQFYVDVNRVSLTPEHEVESNSLQNSPDRENDGAEDPGEDLEESTDEEFLKIFMDSCSSSEEEAISSSSDSKGCEKTYDRKAYNILISSKKKLDFESAGSSKVKNPDTASHSFQEASKIDESSIQNEKPSCSYSKESKFDTKKYKSNVQTADDIYQFGRQLTEKLSGILNSNKNELHKSDTVRHLEISNSDNLTAESLNTSSKENRVQPTVAESGRRKKSVPKRKNVR